jgi:hypothetical protein
VKKSELKHLKLKVSVEHVRLWDKFFWCERHQQYVTLGICNWRHSHTEEYPAHVPCVKCVIRKHSFRVYRKPRLAIRKPRKI